VEGVTAAAIGAIAGAVLVLAKRNLTDIPTILIAITTAALLFQFKKLQEPIMILAAAIVGVLLKLYVL
jgi:chromate transporter